MPINLPFLRRETTLSAPEQPNFSPVLLLEVELSRTLPAISGRDPRTGQSYRRVLALVRLHTRPLGQVEMDLDQHGLSSAALAERIWCVLGHEISEHMRQDGLPEPERLEASGIPCAAAPGCIQARDRLLAHAPFASVVVATRDRAESLVSCFGSLLSLRYPNYEIIVVDNAPTTNATADFVGQIKNSRCPVRYVREDRPGLSAARNRGVLEAQGGIVAITDDDVLVDPYWLAELVHGFTVTENVGCVTGHILPAEIETPTQLWLEQFGGFSKGFTRRIFDLADHRQSSPLYPYNAGTFGSGANLAFKASVLRELGGFDAALGAGTCALGGEDLAAYFQIIARGYRLVYEPGALVRHFHRRDYAGLRRQMYSYGVGLTAYLTKCLFDEPKRFLEIAGKVPHGLYFALSPQSAKNQKKQADYPAELTRLERMGMLYGPFAYLRSRWRARHMQDQFSPLQRQALGSVIPDNS